MPFYLKPRFWVFCVGVTIILVFINLEPGFYLFRHRPKASVPTSSSLTPGSVGIYLLNLDRSPDRLKKVMPLLQQLPFPLRRISAMDGKRLSRKELAHTLDLVNFQRTMGRLPGKGEIGCALSHLKAWTAFLASSYDYALVFEDDARFHPEKVACAVTALLNQNNLWDICNLDIRAKGERLHGFSRLGTISGHEIRLYYQGVYCTDAYLINRKAASRLLAQALPLIMTIEDFFARAWEFDITYTALHPSLTTLQDVPSVLAATSVVNPDSQDKVSPTWAAFFGKVYRIKTGLIRSLYGAKLWIQFKLGIA